MTIKGGNWSFTDPGGEIADGEIIEGGNFSQLAPDTPIMVGKSLMVNGGNFVNVRKDAAWVINGGNFSQISRCAYIHPEWSLPPEAENCSHVTRVDTVTIDGVLVDTIYHYEDTVQ